MLTSSCKSKGRSLCIWFRQRILDTFGEINPHDIKVTSSGSGGEDIYLSSMVRDMLPFQFEAKNLARFVGYTYMGQAISHGPHAPVVLIKANRQQPLVILDAEIFIKLCKEAYGGRK